MRRATVISMVFAFAALMTLQPASAQLKKLRPMKDDHAKKITEAVPDKARAKPKKKRKVLAWIRPRGFVHGSILHGAHAVKEMGRKTGAWETVISSDLAMFMPQNLKQFDMVVLCNTTGDWIKPAKEDMEKLGKYGDAKAIEAALKKSFLDWVRAGGGVAGFHSATDALKGWAEFGELIGGYFDGHPWHEDVGVKLDEPKHTLCKAFEGKTGFVIKDEIYQFRAVPYSRKNLRVLLSLDVTKTNMNKGKKIKRTDGDFGVAWIHSFGKGRVFYSSLGHREEIYWNPMIMSFYLDGLQYALGDLEADDKPSAAK